MALDGTSSLHTRAGAFDATRRQPIKKPTGLKPGWNPNKWEPTKRQAIKALKSQKWHRTTDAAVTEVAREILTRAILETVRVNMMGKPVSGMTGGPPHGIGGLKIKAHKKGLYFNNAEPPDAPGSTGWGGPAGRTAHANL
jgi:hypothetical protein